MHLLLLVAVLVQAGAAGRLQRHHLQQPADDPAGLHYTAYTKHHPGRHVCTTQKNVTLPVKSKESYCKPVFKKYVENCNHNQLCTGVRLTYETAYRDVVTIKTTSHTVYVCCPGWTQINNRSHGCNKGQCSAVCQNGGSCVKSNWCSCLRGFTGRYCELDVDECKEQKPCDQICHNTFGSYKCECRENFVLQGDGQSCHRADGNGPALEAKDLEYELLDRRLLKLETMLSAGMNVSAPADPGEVQTIARRIDGIARDISALKSKVEELESFQVQMTSHLVKLYLDRWKINYNG